MANTIGTESKADLPNKDEGISDNALSSTNEENGGTEGKDPPRHHSCSSDYENLSPRSQKRERTLLTMLREIKERVNESNRRTRSHRTSNPDITSTPNLSKTQVGIPEDAESPSLPDNITVENNIMLKALLAESRENGSSIDCLNDRMEQIKTLVGQSLTQVNLRLDKCDVKLDELSTNIEVGVRGAKIYTDVQIGVLNQKCETKFDCMNKSWQEYKSDIDETISKWIDEGITKAFHSLLFAARSTVLIEEQLAKLRLDLDKKNTDLSHALSTKAEKMHEDFLTSTKSQTSELQQLLQQWQSRATNPPNTHQFAQGPRISNEEWQCY